MHERPNVGSKIIIVGGGCFGLSTAYALSLEKEKNYDIHVYDRGAIPIKDAASTDINKTVRMDYGSSRLYMQLAIDSIDLWYEWNNERTEQGLIPIYHNTGILVFSTNGSYSDNEKQSLKNIREAGHDDFIEELTPEQIKTRYPFFDKAVDNGYDIAYFNRVGGWCNSSEAIKHLYIKCLQNGVNFILGETAAHFISLLTDPQDGRSVTGIKTADGKKHDGDHIILATGSWTPSVINMHRQALATGQVVVQFKLSKDDRITLKNLPVWCGDVSRTGFYGFPDNGDGIMKIAKHSTGYLNPRDEDKVSVPRTQISNSGDTIPLCALNEIRKYLDEFLPITTPFDISYSRVCWYSESIDGHFVICPHPDYNNLIVATGDSGHAMKFFPIIGEKIKDVIEAKDTEYTRAWVWRSEEAQEGFFDRPLLIKKGDKNERMATLDELKSKVKNI